VTLRTVIVDDSRHFLDAACDVLEREGLTVVGCATTSDHALRLAEALRPDVVLVDVDLGEESGFDLAERLSATANVQAILISVYPESELTDLIEASSAVGFVAKSELSARAVLEVVDHGESQRD
jgi:DNA-binding response OmpR family regulator